MTRRRAALAPLLLATALPLLLAACGRAGPPRPPGPREAVIYPRIYPAPETAPVPPAAPVAVPRPAPSAGWPSATVPRPGPSAGSPSIVRPLP